MAYRLSARIGGKDCRHPIGPGSNILGSAPGSDLVMPDPTISRRHARIHCAEAGLALEDLGSRNGTTINARPVTETTTFNPGDRLQFGDVIAVVEELAGEDLQAAVRGSPSEPTRAETPPDTRPTLDGSRLGRLVSESLIPLLRDLRAGGGSLQRIVTTLHHSFPEARFRLRHNDPRGALIGEAGETRDGKRGRLRIHGLLLDWVAPKALHPDIETAGRVLLELSGLTGARGMDKKTPLENTPTLPEPETQHPGLREIYREAARVARGRIGVLITGDSGTGKELLARYIHAASGLPAEHLLVLNCAALPEDLLETELFGIEKGVATGVDARPGKFEMANSGTLFLDEIAEMSPATQSKILRVLQEKTTYRVGGHEPRSADVRIIAATNQSLAELVERGSFRRDLYHRIAGWTARLPDLAERSMDIVNLAAHFLEKEMKHRGERFGGISVGAAEALRAYTWPGNVRELELEMARAALFLGNGEMLDSSMLEERIRTHEPGDPKDLSLDSQLARAEAAAIRDALARSGNNVSRASRLLGIGRSTIYRRMRQLGIAGDGEAAGEAAAEQEGK